MMLTKLGVLVKRSRSGWILGTAVVFGLVMPGCGAAARHSQASVPAGTSGNVASTPAEQARKDGGVQAYTAADVSFMQGMIHHHAQAVVMAGWASTHGASGGVKILASRIDVGQRDEIAFMKRWLRERHQMVPGPYAKSDTADRQPFMSGMSMPGMPGMSMPDTLMPGMLTPQQLAQLSAANGAEFDRLFLTFMIQHHQGAVTMVDKLFSSPGAGQEEYVFRFASDVNTDQTTEIERMRLMLSHVSGGRSP
jgi:uncharacterized protein (DUF305 family)